MAYSNANKCTGISNYIADSAVVIVGAHFRSIEIRDAMDDVSKL
jgi:hypothetical protein